VARVGYVRLTDGTLAEHPEHLEVVKEAFALRARGGSWGETARLLAARGVPTARSSRVWSRQSVRHLIGNRAYRAPAGPVPAWRWEKAQPTGAGTRAMRGEGYTLGQGLCRCQTCDAGLVRTHSRGATFLRCPTIGKGHVAIGYDKAEDFILSLAFSHLGPMLKRKPGGDLAELEALREIVEKVKAEFEQARELLGVTPPAGSKPALALEVAESALAEFEAKADTPLGLADFLTPVGVRQEFAKSPVAEQQRILRQLISKVILSPGRGTPGARLAVEFTDGTLWPAPPTDAPEVPAENGTA
jgi:hypothetical protein